MPALSAGTPGGHHGGVATSRRTGEIKMRRKLTVVLAGAFLLAGAGCSKDSTTTTASSTTTSTSVGTTSTTSTGTTMTSGTAVASPRVTRPSVVEKIDKSSLPPQARVAPKNVTLTSDESD